VEGSKLNIPHLLLYIMTQTSGLLTGIVIQYSSGYVKHLRGKFDE